MPFTSVSPRSSLLEYLLESRMLKIRQQVEYAELFGCETLNTYGIERDDGIQIGFAAERPTGLAGFFGLQFFGHWRRFSVSIIDNERQLVMEGRHPFRLFFSRIAVVADDGREIGAVQRQFSFLAKKFRVESADGRPLFHVWSPFWRPWTFKFKRKGEVVAVIRKRWNGILQESFTDADQFDVIFESPALELHEKMLLLTAGIFIDIQYFEKKARSKR